jgi:hypothetical protein
MSAKGQDKQLTRLWTLLGDSAPPAEHPPLSTLAVLTCSHRFAAGREILQVRLDASGWHVTRHCDNDSTWTTTETSGGGGLEEALSHEPSLGVLSSDGTTHWATNETELPTHALLPHLRVTGPRADSPPADELDDHEWSDEDEAIEASFGDANWRPIRGRINGKRVTAIEIRSDGGEIVVPVLVDPDEGELDPIEEIAITTWFSESGGAPISWDGGSSLTRLNGRLGYARQWGDYGAEHEFVLLPDSPEQLAQTVAQWILGCEAAVAAALAFEPLDPNETLTADEREHWNGLLAAPAIDLTVELPDATLDLVQARLSQDSLYSATAEALHNPDATLGLALRAALEDVEETGVLGQLVSGEWTAVASAPVTAAHVLSDGRCVPLVWPATVTTDDRVRTSLVEGWLTKGFGVAVYGTDAPSHYSLLLSYGGEGAFLPTADPPESAPGYLSDGDCPPLRGVIPPRWMD